MCTVSFVRVKDSIIITSNRDEHIHRTNAAAPELYFSGQKKMIFPKDVKAGGTWFVAADNGVVAVLLNGAFIKHIAQPPYRKSRGLILLEIIEAGDPYLFFISANLDNIEPFTVILYQPGSLYELRWDGKNKYQKLLDTFGHYIWSSSTLYSDEVIEQRKNLFEQFIHETNEITAELVRDLHGDDHGDAENGFVISRQTGMKTFSITQAVVKAEDIQFLHTDLLQQKQFTETMYINQAAINL